MNWLSDIYLIDAQGAAKVLNNRSMSDESALKHVVVALAFGWLSFEVPLSFPFWGAEFELKSYIYQFIAFILNAFIVYYGVRFSYRINAAGDGAEFFKRFTVLLLPVGVRVVLLFIPIMMVAGVISSYFGEEYGEESGGFVLALFGALGLVYQVIFYSQMGQYMTVASKKDGQRA